MFNEIDNKLFKQIEGFHNKIQYINNHLFEDNKIKNPLETVPMILLLIHQDIAMNPDYQFDSCQYTLLQFLKDKRTLFENMSESIHENIQNINTLKTNEQNYFDEFQKLKHNKENYSSELNKLQKNQGKYFEALINAKTNYVELLEKRIGHIPQEEQKKLYKEIYESYNDTTFFEKNNLFESIVTDLKNILSIQKETVNEPDEFEKIMHRYFSQSRMNNAQIINVNEKEIVNVNSNENENDEKENVNDEKENDEKENDVNVNDVNDEKENDEKENDVNVNDEEEIVNVNDEKENDEKDDVLSDKLFNLHSGPSLQNNISQSVVSSQQITNGINDDANIVELNQESINKSDKNAQNAQITKAKSVEFYFLLNFCVNLLYESIKNNLNLYNKNLSGEIPKQLQNIQKQFFVKRKNKKIHLKHVLDRIWNIYVNSIKNSDITPLVKFAYEQFTTICEQIFLLINENRNNPNNSQIDKIVIRNLKNVGYTINEKRKELTSKLH
jgi:hypothetical protein